MVTRPVQSAARAVTHLWIDYLWQGMPRQLQLHVRVRGQMMGWIIIRTD